MTNTINKMTAELPMLMEGRKLMCKGYVYWANTTTLEIYAHSEDDEIAGVINGWKVADIDPETWTVYRK